MSDNDVAASLASNVGAEQALLLLFRSSTGENWQQIMAYMVQGPTDCGACVETGMPGFRPLILCWLAGWTRKSRAVAALPFST